MRFPLKHLFIILLMFTVSPIVFSQNQYYSHKNKLGLTISPVIFNIDSGDSLINIKISNEGTDTLVLINRLDVVGFNNWVFPYPALVEYNFPNLMILWSDDFPVSTGTGKYDISFSELPDFLIIPPFIEKNYFVDFGKYRNHLTSKTWEIEIFFVFAKKNILDEIILKNYNFDDYLLRLNYSDIAELQLIKPEEYIHEVSGNNYNLIKEAFNINAIF